MEAGGVLPPASGKESALTYKIAVFKTQLTTATTESSCGFTPHSYAISALCAIPLRSGLITISVAPDILSVILPRAYWPFLLLHSGSCSVVRFEST